MGSPLPLWLSLPYWVLLDITSVLQVVFTVPAAVISEASLPDICYAALQVVPPGEAAFDQLQAALQGRGRWRQKQVEVVRHDDKGVQLIVFAVVLDGVEEEFGVPFHLEEWALAGAVGFDEVGAKVVTRWMGSIAQRLKPCPSES